MLFNNIGPQKRYDVVIKKNIKVSSSFEINLLQGNIIGITNDDQWRIVFRWVDNHAYDVEIMGLQNDYDIEEEKILKKEILINIKNKATKHYA